MILSEPVKVGVRSDGRVGNSLRSNDGGDDTNNGRNIPNICHTNMGFRTILPNTKGLSNTMRYNTKDPSNNTNPNNSCISKKDCNTMDRCSTNSSLPEPSSSKAY